MAETETPLRGVLHLHSETGTEGGYWAFQDERHITENVTHVCCKKCGSCWNAFDDPAGPSGPVDFPLSQGRILRHERCGVGEHDPEISPPHFWSYDGLHCLEDGDRLTIFDKADPQKVVWSGIIALKRHELFTEHARGMWIHADQVGIPRDDWARWFFDGNPAELIRARP